MTRDARETARELIRSLKNRPCADCRIQYPPYVMQFDHVRGRKRFTMANAARDWGLAAIREEAQKCDIVCANCHAIRTHSRRHILPAPAVTRYNPPMPQVIIYSYLHSSGHVVFSTSPDGPWVAGNEEAFLFALGVTDA